MPPNRIVALATPIAAPIAGAAATWLAQNFPGVNIPASALEEIFIAAAVVVLGSSAQWLHGYQKFEAREAAATQVADAADDRELELGSDGPTAIADEPDPLFEDDDDADEMSEDDIEALLAGDDLDEEEESLVGSPGRSG